MRRAGSAFSGLSYAGALALVACLAATASAGEVLSDPTRPLREPAPVASAHVPGARQPTLSSVLVGAGRKVAVIDGRGMTEGEEHDGIRVWEIRADGVVVSMAGSRRVLLELAGTRMHKEPR